MPGPVPKTTVVIPCFNEAGRLPEASFMAFVDSCSDIDFLFVNDGSTDETEAVLSGLVERNSARFRLHSLDVNRGKAEAVREGILAALGSHPRPDYVGFWDADLATPLDAIPRLLQVLEGNTKLQMVLGARVKLLGRAIERNPLRHYPGRIFATLVSMLLRLPIYDSQCGAKMFRATDTTEGLFAKPFATRWIFDIEILARFLQARGTEAANEVFEYPLEEWRDVPGSKLKPMDVAKTFLDLARVYRLYPRR